MVIKTKKYKKLQAEWDRISPVLNAIDNYQFKGGQEEIERFAHRSFELHMEMKKYEARFLNRVGRVLTHDWYKRLQAKPTNPQECAAGQIRNLIYPWDRQVISWRQDLTDDMDELRACTESQKKPILKAPLSVIDASNNRNYLAYTSWSEGGYFAL
jgi:hypothetical protein